MKKNTLITLALTALTLSFAGCGNQTDTSADITTKIEKSVTESTENVPESEANVNPEAITAETEMETTETESTEEMITETIAAESQVEMVDFETWAKQEGNEEVCLVVWNEELGVQEIVPTWKETEEIYEIQNGDKFAIPFNEIVLAMYINDESGIYPATADFFEASLIKGELNEVTIIFKNEDGETKTKDYLLK